MKNDGQMEQNILDKAESLFLRKGFALTSTTEIAREAGCNQALIHYYFRTKEKLFEAVFKHKLKIFISSFLQIDEGAVSFEGKLQRTIETHFDMLYKNQNLPFLIINELITNPNRVSAIKEQVKGKIQTIFKQFEKEMDTEIQKGNIREITALNLFISILALNISVFLMKPMMTEALGMDENSFREFALKRKEENVITILNSLRVKEGLSL